MSLIKSSLLNGIAVLVKMVSLLGLNKVLAIYVGPAGYAAVGQLQNAVQILTTISSGAINSGVVKYTAEYGGEADKERALWKTAGALTAYASAVLALFMAIFNLQLSAVFFGNEQFGSVFLWFAIGIVFFSYNALLLALLNGKQEMFSYVLANIAGSLLSFFATLLLTSRFGLYGALVALVTYQSFSFVVTACVLRKRDWFRWGYIVGRVDPIIAKNLGRFALMALTSATCVPLAQMLIRHHLIQVFGGAEAGYWEAMSRLSSAYLLMITTTLGVYYLPRLSELKSGQAIKREIIDGYKVIIPLMLLGCGFVYLVRDWVVSLLFTQDFLPMRVLFAGQLVGDVLKIVSWVVSYVMLSKAMLRLFILTEVASCVLLYGLTLLFTHYLGLEGAAWAYAMNYLVYGVAMYVCVYRRLDDRLGPEKGQLA